MKKNAQKIDALFREGIEAFEEMPPLRVLDALQNQLDQQNAVETNNNRKRWLVAALLLLIITSGIWVTYRTVNINHTTAVAAQTETPVSTQPAIAFSKKKVAESSEMSIAANGEILAGSDAVIAEKAKGKAIKNNAVTGGANASAADFENLSAQRNNRQFDGSVTGNLNKATAAVGNNIFKPVADNDFKQTQVIDNYVAAVVKENTNAVLDDELNATQKREDGEIVPLKPLMLAGAGTIPQQLVSNIKLSKNALVKYSRPSRWAFTAFISPEVSSRTIEEDPIHRSAGFKDEDKDEISHTETPEVDFTGGLLAEYKLSKRLSIQSGIAYSNITIDIQPKTIFARYDLDGSVKFRFNCSSGYGFFTPKNMNPPKAGDSIKSVASTNTLKYISIPLAVKYYLPYKRFNFFVQAGITAKFVVDQEIETGYAVGGIKEKRVLKAINGLKTNYFNGQIGVGADYNLSKHFALTVAPIINFAISSLNENSPVKSYQHNFGVISGIKFKL